MDRVAYTLGAPPPPPWPPPPTLWQLRSEAISNVALSVREARCVHRQHQRAAACALRPLDKHLRNGPAE
jgi:hypothetical protein